MSLPFLNKNKSVAGLIIKQRKPDSEPKTDESDDRVSGLDTASHDLHRAVQAGDIKAISSALKAAFDILDSEPNEESTNNYDDQNIIAGREER